MSKTPVDIVILWVDSNDRRWQKEKAAYSGVSIDDREIRYRDWDNLQYIFRGIEKFAPWVNNVFFITCGHLPSWLNTQHPKLKIVNHKDYIPKEYLPTFSSNPIELNLHRLEGLSENFILFNDDTFILDSLKEEDFFVNGKPKDIALLNVHCYDINTMNVLTPFLDIGIINKHFDMKKVIRSNISKWYNYRYGYHMLRNFLFLPCPRFPGLVIDHLPVAHLKSTFVKLWQLEYESLHQTSSHKFRNQLDVNHWLMREWNIVNGDFYPRSLKIGKSFGVYESNIEMLYQYIANKQSKLICLNDTEMTQEAFEMCKRKLLDAFGTILPERSLYEK